MSSYKVFISGRVTGLHRPEAERNFERGKKAILQNGWSYINPLEIIPADTPYKDAMKVCCDKITDDDTNAILLLNDHKFSPGSHIEEELARICGLQIFYEDDLIS
jgi:hypothetical protein